MIINAHHNYGWKPDLPDFRDWKYDHSKSMLLRTNPIPPMCTLQPLFPPPFDQGELGSCTANAVAGTDEALQKKYGETPFTPSRLFIYYAERVLEGTVSSDSGASIRDSMRVMCSVGACPETMWPYATARFAVQPSPICYAQAKKNVITSYVSVLQSEMALKSCLLDGFPVNIGFTVYDSFESENTAVTGIMTLPGPSEEVLGGHAVVIVGYFDNGHVPLQGSPTHPSGGFWLVRNSWGAEWGWNGYFFMPYSYATNENLSDDFWSARTINDAL